MINLLQLNHIINNKGLKKKFLAEQLGISQNCIHSKLTGENEFKLSEVSNLSKILHLTKKQRNEIFFGD